MKQYLDSGRRGAGQQARIGRKARAGALAVLIAGTTQGVQAEQSRQSDSQEPKLGTVVIQGARQQAPVEQAKAKVEEIAGGASVVDNAEVEKGRSANLEDVLALQPGVYAQSAGNDAIKISIRGSGANASPGYFREGTKFLFDGLALTGPGGTPYELLDTAGTSHTEVLRGANAFEYGALSLGGAINMVTHTGKTSPGHYARLEFGSFGWRKQQLSTGGEIDNGDYYLSLSNYEREGYQDYSFSKAKGVVGNFGYRFTPDLETRLIVRYRTEHHENSATLTKAQLKDDPTQTNPLNPIQKATADKHGSTWIGSKTTYRLDDDSKVEFGLVYHNYPQVLSERSSVNPNFWSWRDINTSLRYLRSDQVFGGRQSDTTLSLSNTTHLAAAVKTYNGTTGALLKDTDYGGSSDSVIALGNELELTERLWLSSGLSLVNVRRDIDVTFSDRVNTSGLPAHYTRDNWSLAPRLGLRYYLTPDIQLFGNVSRSIDPPSSWSHSQSGPTNNFAKPLVEQKANTVELGIRGRQGIFEGSLSVYRSWIKQELLNVEIVAAAPGRPAVNSTSNSSPTIHQGVELGLNTQLWEGDAGDEVVLRQSYTFNDFHYENDDRFSANELPGLPRHIYQAQLQYQHPSGFYAGLNVNSVSRAAVDYANSFYAPSYTLFGARLGYEAPDDRWSVYLDLKNLTDEKYATAISPLYDVAGVDSRGLYPGDGFGAFTGVSFRF